MKKKDDREKGEGKNRGRGLRGERVGEEKGEKRKREEVKGEERGRKNLS